MDITRVLKKDAKGPDVQALSEQLSRLGYDTGSTIEQTFGNDLKRAVKEFQSDFGLKADGIVGSATLKVLAAAVNRLRRGSLRVSSDNRTRIAQLHDEILSRLKELSSVMGNSLELGSELSVNQFTITRSHASRRVDIKFDGRQISVGSTTPVERAPDGDCVVYIDPQVSACHVATLSISLPCGT